MDQCAVFCCCLLYTSSITPTASAKSPITIAAFVIGDFAEAVGVMLFYRIGELFEDIAVEKSRGQIMDAVDMRPEVVNLVVGSEVKEIPSQDARVKDIIMIRPGDRIDVYKRQALGHPLLK